MGDEVPKLFSARPKKSKLKASTPASSSLRGATAPPLSHQKASSRSHYRVLVPLVLGLNFAIGAYVLVKTTLRNRRLSEEEIPEGSASSTSNSTSIHSAHSTTTDSRGSLHEFCNGMAEEKRC